MFSFTGRNYANGTFLSLELQTLIESKMEKEQETIENQRLAAEIERQRLEQNQQQPTEAQREKDFW